MPIENLESIPKSSGMIQECSHSAQIANCRSAPSTDNLISYPDLTLFYTEKAVGDLGSRLRITCPFFLALVVIVGRQYSILIQ